MHAKRLISLLLLTSCASTDFVEDAQVDAFSMQYEPVLAATEDMRMSFGDNHAWVVSDGELTVYDESWMQVRRVGGVQAAAAVLDLGVWISNELVVSATPEGAATVVPVPAELGQPIDIRRGDGGELWIMGLAGNGGALASSIDGGSSWSMAATGLLAGGGQPDQLELRNTLGGLAVVIATNTSAGAVTTWRVTGSGASEWPEGAFIAYPRARTPGGYAGQGVDTREQFDATTATWTESWSSEQADGWQWTHGAGLDLRPERTPLTVLGADPVGRLYVHDNVGVYRSTTPFSPENDQDPVLGAGTGCDRRYDIDWSVPLGEVARDTRIRNGTDAPIFLYELFEDGLVALRTDGLSIDGGADIVMRLESWLYVTDAAGRCLWLVRGRDLRGREHVVELPDAP